MKNIAGIILVLAFTAAGILAQERVKVSGPNQDEAAIRAAVDQMVKGWNTKSGVDFARPFADDSDYVIINGQHIKSRAVIASGHQQIFDTSHKTSVLTLSVEQIRFLRPDVALVHVLGEMNVPGDAARSGAARITLVMAKNERNWEIAAFQNTPIKT